MRDADDLVGRLPVEFEIDLGFRLAIVPRGVMSNLAPSQRPLRQRGALDGDAHTRRLPRNARFPGDGFGGGNNSSRNEAAPALILAREHIDGVAFRDVLAAIHRLLRGEHKRARPRIAKLDFDREGVPCLVSQRLSLAHAGRVKTAS